MDRGFTVFEDRTLRDIFESKRNERSKLLYNLYSYTALLLLTPWIVVILEKLAEKCPTFYESQKIQFGVRNSPQYFCPYHY